LPIGGAFFRSARHPAGLPTSEAVPLLSAVTSLKHLTADKAYDADRLRNWLQTRRQPFGLESSLFCQAIQMD
jgi:hypothetical protein